MGLRLMATMLVALGFATAAARAEDTPLSLDPPSPRPQLLVIGSFHMDNPGRDVVNMKADDVLAPRRQREIEQVADAIARFKPTRIAIEYPRGKQAELDRDYAAYRDGKRELGRSEDEQLGMRLAKRLSLPQLHAVELSDLMPPVDIAVIDYEAGAKRVGQEAFLAAMRERVKARVGAGDKVLREGTIGQALRWFNDPEQLRESHRGYFNYARIADGDDTPGANWLQFWYGRNLKIFGALTRIAGPGDRVLVIYGAGHAPLLRQFAEQSGYFDVVDPLPYLDTRDAGTASVAP